MYFLLLRGKFGRDQFQAVRPQADIYLVFLKDHLVEQQPAVPAVRMHALLLAREEAVPHRVQVREGLGHLLLVERGRDASCLSGGIAVRLGDDFRGGEDGFQVIEDPVTGKEKLVPPSGAVAGCFARSDQKAYVEKDVNVSMRVPKNMGRTTRHPNWIIEPFSSVSRIVAGRDRVSAAQAGVRHNGANIASCGPPTRREQVLEVLTFLLLIIPSMVLSFFAVRQGSLSFPLTAVATISRDIALVCLVLFFLRRNGESLLAIGWTRRHWVRDVILGFVLYPPFLFAVGLAEQMFTALGVPAHATPLPSDLSAAGGEYILGTVLVLVVAVAEETVFRGYLNLRLKNVTAGWVPAIVLSSFIFAIGHGYEGTIGVMTVGVMGAVFSLIYLWRGSLVTPIVIHFVQDFIGIVLIPLLTH